MLVVAVLCLCLASLPAAMFLANRRRYRPLPLLTEETARLPAVSVLVPARNEERVLAAALAAISESRAVDFEVLVGDDHSTDRTAQIVLEAAQHDPRTRLIQIPDLPAGWCGKQHACWTLAQAARHELLVFLDADVRLEPDTLARLAQYMARQPVALASGFPRQETGTFLERLLIPLIHFLLLGYLPMGRMRRYATSPAYAAGCGQLFIARRDDYLKMGGHAAIRTSLHDGIKLPRAFRAAGLATDLFDATDLATCRMYTRGSDVWMGFAKNATEGIASSLLSLLVWTVLLGLGHVAPLVMLLVALNFWDWSAEPAAGVFAAALVVGYIPRLLGVRWFRQSKLGAALHPLGIATLLALQWFAWTRQKLGYAPGWKGRSYPSVAGLATEGKAT